MTDEQKKLRARIELLANTRKAVEAILDPMQPEDRGAVLRLLWSSYMDSTEPPR